MIVNNNVQSILKAYADQPLRNSTKDKMKVATDEPIQDKVSLSNQAQSFSHILQKAKVDQSIRQEKVDQITKDIQSGQYQIDARLIAEKMLNNRF